MPRVIEMTMLRVKKNDRVRIHSQGLVAEGTVRSVYDSWIYADGTESGAHNIIGYEPDGIEMSDEKSRALKAGVPTGKLGAYRYWKRGDGGHVYLLKPDGEWVQVFPRTFGGYNSNDE